MRAKDKGQRFDHSWKELNALIEKQEGNAAELLKKVVAIVPKSDYELKDKANLINCIKHYEKWGY